MRATFMPCSSSGIAQPTITSSIARRVERRHLRQHARERRARAGRRGASLRNTPRGALPTACASRRRCRRPGFAWSCSRSFSSAAACRSAACARSAPASSLVAQQLHEVAALERRGATPRRPALPGVDVAAAQHVARSRGRSSKSCAQMKPPSRMLTSSILSVAIAGPAGDRDTARWQRRPVAARRPAPAPAAIATCSSSCAFITTTSRRAQVAELPALERALADLRHRDRLEDVAQERQAGRRWRLPARGRSRRRAATSSLQPPPAGSRPTPDLDQADVALERRDRARRSAWMNSQPPPSAMPRTAATVGTRL